LGLAAEEFGARFYGNNARPGVVLSHPGHLGEDAFDRLAVSWKQAHEGLENAHRVAILEEGMQVTEVGIPPSDAQFLETRQFQIREIARIFRVAPHMIQDLENATFSNIEHQGIDFVTHTLLPWITRIEQSIQRCLITNIEKSKGYYCKFNPAGLLRGDLKSRYDAYAVARQWGWFSADDVREMEEQNPLPNGAGQVYLSPMNMVPSDQLGKPAPAPAKDPAAAPADGAAAAPADGADPLADPGPFESEPRAGAPAGVEGRARALFERRAADSVAARQKLQRSHQRAYADALTRIKRRESRELRDLVKKHLKTRSTDGFSAAVEEFYRGFRDHIASTMRPVALPFADGITGECEKETEKQGDPAAVERFTDSYLDSYATRYGLIAAEEIRKSMQRLAAAGEDPAEGMDAEFSALPDSADSEAHDETIRMGAGVALFVYRLVGVTKKRWHTMGAETCPYCQSLSGKVVGIDEVFVSGGTDWHPEGAEESMHVSRDFGHAPAHGGCDCMISAAF